MDPNDKALSIAARIADGTGVDWPAMPPAGAADDALLGELRLIAEVASVHRAPQSAAANQSTADTWGSLTILDRIGAGRFGEVFVAWDARLHRRVALKLLHNTSESLLSPTRAIDEARLLARVRHPNVLTVYGAECLHNQIGIWTEFLEGRTLEQLVAERGRLEPDEVAAIGVDLCRALEAVHAAGLLHRDVKAQNVMRETGGRIVLMDFGAGHDLELAEPREGDYTGTPLYLAPEVLAGGAASTASDIYAVGVLLFHLLTGSHPVSGKTLADIHAAHQANSWLRLSALRPDLSPALLSAIDRCLEPNPLDRFPTAGALKASLETGHTSGAAQPMKAGRLHRPWQIAIVSIVVAVTAATAMFFTRDQTVPFKSRDWILVTHFENRTGDAALDGSLEYAIASELGNSRYVNVVPLERVRDTLRFMQRPDNTRIDEALGREICQRDGHIRAMLVGRVERLKSGYLLNTALVDPSSGVTVASVTEQSESDADILAAIRRMSLRVRDKLGEDLESIRQTTRATAQVTTRSLKAFQLYAQAQRLLAEMTWHPVDAVVLLKEAIDEDSEFASAHALLAVALEEQGEPETEYVAAASRAMQLASRVSDRERYFIEGKYYEAIQRRDLALAAYQKLNTLYPDDDNAIGNLMRMLNASHRADETVPLLVRHAELRPNDLPANALAAHWLQLAGNTQAAAIHFERASTLAAAVDPSCETNAGSWLALTPVRTAWLEDTLSEAIDAARVIEQTTAVGSSMCWVELGWVHTSFGQLSRAEEIFRQTSDQGWRERGLTFTAFLKGDRPTLLKRLRPFPTAGVKSPMMVSLMIRAGMLAEAETKIRGMQVSSVLATQLLGDLALARGETEKGIGLLEPEIFTSHVMLHPTTLMAAEALAHAYEHQGKLADAIRTLERFYSEAARLWHPGNHAYWAFWLRTQAQLTELYLKAGRTDDARTTGNHLRLLLAKADPDHPILKQLAR